MGSNESIKNSVDYKRVLEVIAVLNNKRERAKKDLEELKRIKEEALSDPTDFVEKLVNKKLGRLPSRQKIPEIPNIDFNNYVLYTTNSETVDSTLSPSSALNPIKKEKKRENSKKKPPIIRKNGDTQLYLTENEKPQAGDVVRGRMFTPEKPLSFNKLWTPEEQKRLEELLEIYPDEPIASNRWKKIAEALGGRTPKQVASRTQKYFIKLSKQGRPVPGKPPNMEYYNNPKKKKRKNEGREIAVRQVKKRDLDPSYYQLPPVVMSDDEDELNYKLEEMDPELKDSEEYKELMELLKLKQLQETKKNEVILNTQAELVHEGFKCDSCGMDPIIGVRWKCSTCPEQNQLDLCENCKETNVETDTHTKDHIFIKVDKVEAVPYYLNYNHEWISEEPNYLDPSFMSA